jgi:predicted CopG family antitoxin
MGTRTVRLDDDVYERIKRRKRADETFSEAVDRLVGGESLAELGEIFTDEDVAEMEAAIAEADEADAREVEELLDQFDDR